MELLRTTLRRAQNFALVLVVTSCVATTLLMLVIVAQAPNGNQSTKRITIRIPDVRPDHGEQYLCMSHRVSTQDASGQYIIGFNPIGDSKRVHHMIVYGCEQPGILQRDSPNFVWDCGAMHAASEDKPQEISFEEAPVCRGKTEILYGWALNAPALKLPKGVGFKIGGTDSGIKYLVLQVHYAHYNAFAVSPELTDNSGLILDIVKPNNEITRRAGVMIMMSSGYVERGVSKHEIWCELNDDIEIHPFRYRVHTHKLGIKVMGAKIGKDQRNELGYKINEDLIIGIHNPQEPQMFYPVREPNITLSRGDSIYASCEFNNNKSHIVQIGQTGDDEMCNFYLMYWTDNPNLLSQSGCISRNPPRSYQNLLSEYSNGMF